MKNKYTIEEKKAIVNEAINNKNKAAIAIKYNIHYTTIYSWIRRFTTLKGRDYQVTFKLSKQEHSDLKEKCCLLGYENDVSSYIRKLLFSKHIASGHPHDIVKELYKVRGEFNKLGSNLNQIASYINFLKKQNYVDDSYLKKFENLLTEFLTVSKGHKILLDKTIRKI